MEYIRPRFFRKMISESNTIKMDTVTTMGKSNGNAPETNSKIEREYRNTATIDKNFSFIFHRGIRNMPDSNHDSITTQKFFMVR